LPDWAKGPDPSEVRAAKKAQAALSRKEVAAARVERAAKRKQDQVDAYQHIHGVTPTEADLAGFVDNSNEGCACGPLCCVPGGGGQKGRSCVTKTSAVLAMIVWGGLITVCILRDMTSITKTGEGRAVYNVFQLVETSAAGDEREPVKYLHSAAWCEGGVGTTVGFCIWQHRASSALLCTVVILPFAAAFWWWASRGSTLETSKTVKAAGRTSTTITTADIYRTDGKCTQMLAFVLSVAIAAGCTTLHGVRVFRQKSPLEDAIGSHACSFGALPCV
jgi:hypothetical protein